MQEKISAIFESVEEVAATIGLSRSRTYAGLNNGEIPARRVGKRFIVSRVAIQRWLEGTESKAA